MSIFVVDTAILAVHEDSALAPQNLKERLNRLEKLVVIVSGRISPK